MKEDNYQAPEFQKKSFYCPHCGHLATQDWSDDIAFLEGLFQYQEQLFFDYRTNRSVTEHHQEAIRIFLQNIKPQFLTYSSRPYFLATCGGCEQFSVWIDEKIVHPLTSSAPLPVENMPENVKEIFEEARQVQPFSPRAAAALLRVALEELTKHLGEATGSLNTRIGNLKKQGLPEKVIKGLDIVRIVANEGGAHAGQIDLKGKDNQETVNDLFSLINLIIERTISDNDRIESFHNQLPQDKKDGINNRDKNNNGTT